MKIVNYIIPLLIILFSGEFISAQPNTPPQWSWAKNLGATTAKSVATDSIGNSYVVGNFSGTVTFGGTSMTSAAQDVFVVKYDAAGAVIWARKACSGTGSEYGNDIAVDTSGNYYITGSFEGTAIIGGTTFINATTYGQDIFLAKFNSSGTLMWAQKYGGIYSDVANSIAVDASGNCYITGYDQSSSNADKVLNAKYNSAGVLQWTKTGTMYSYGAYNEGKGISVDQYGNSYVTGSLRSSGGTRNFFILKLDPSGNTVWQRSTAGYPGNDIVTDPSGNSYVIGGDYNIFIAKYDAAGQVVWERSAGGVDYDYGDGIAIDKLGNCYITGRFQQDADFGGINISNFNSGVSDVFVAKYSSSGNIAWVKQAGSNGVDGGAKIGVDKLGNSYVAGNFGFSIDFDNQSLTGGVNNSFLANIGSNCPVSLGIASVIAGTKICGGAVVKIEYPITGVFNSGNTFTAQLSDASGSFTSPKTLGSLNSATNYPIYAIMPDVTTGTAYRIRVISSSPALTGINNGINLSFNLGYCDSIVPDLGTYPLVAGEYFFNTDPGVGKGISIHITSSDSVFIIAPISVTGLTPGFHNLFTRFKDTRNVWSMYEGRTIYVQTLSGNQKASPIISAESFFDTDPGVGKGTAIASFTAADDISLVRQISIAGLSAGFHNLFIRTKDSLNKWSMHEGRVIYVQPLLGTLKASPVISAESFFDTDPGVGKGTAIASFTQSDNISLIRQISVTGLSAGFHNLFIRVKNTSGTWSFYEGRLFYVIPAIGTTNQPMLASGEWFIDTDPGLGKGTAISFAAADTVNPIINISTVGLSFGTHNLFIRIKNTDSKWSLYEGKTFTICDLPLQAGTPSGITQLCLNPTNSTYTTTGAIAATSYVWEIAPANAGVISANGLNATVDWDNNFIGTASLIVKGHNSCGDGIEGKLAIAVNTVPSAAGSITGNTTVCQGTPNVNYTVPVISGATSYVWTLPTGATGISTTNSITLNYGTTAISGNITVKGNNDCGDGVASELAITISSITIATVTTTNVTSVTSSTAISGGTVNYDGCASITARGVCWSTSSDPTILNSKTTDGNGSGIFTSQISGLIQGTTYYLKAYATNANETVYGEQKSFTTTETGFVLSGQLIYENIAQTPLNNISLSLLNSNNQSVATSTTDASGNFSFPGLSNANYTLSPDIKIPWGGVSAMDITSYKKHIGNIVSLGQLQVKSGDVNKSNSLSTMDLTIIKQRIGAILSAFTVGDWVFDQTAITINGLSLVQNIKALCFGDANGSYTPSNLKSVSNVFLAGNGEIKLLANGEFEIPFVLNKPVNKLSSVTLFINYPFELFDVKGINMIANNDDLFYAINDGTIKVIYSTLNSIDLNEGDLLMTIRFGFKMDALPSVLQDKQFELSGTGEFGDYDDNVLDKVNLSYAASNYATILNDYKTDEIKIYPNPANSQLTVTQVENARITVIDMLGRKLISVDSNSTSVNLDIHSLFSGTYTLMVNKNNKISYRKFSVVK